MHSDSETSITTKSVYCLPLKKSFKQKKRRQLKKVTAAIKLFSIVHTPTFDKEPIKIAF